MTTKELEQFLDAKIGGIHAMISANNDVNNTQHNAILDKLEQVHSEAKKTNGRVTKLEKEISVIRFFSAHPKLTAFIFVIIVSLIYNQPIYELILKIVK